MGGAAGGVRGSSGAPLPPSSPSGHGELHGLHRVDHPPLHTHHSHHPAVQDVAADLEGMVRAGDADGLAMAIKVLTEYGAQVPIRLRGRMLPILLEHDLVLPCIKLAQSLVDDVLAGPPSAVEAGPVLRDLPFWVHKELMRLYRKRGMQERAVGLLNARRALGMPVDRFLHNDAIAVAAEQGELASASALLAELAGAKGSPTTASIEPLLIGHLRARDVAGAYAFLTTVATMDSEMPHNVMVFTKALTACLEMSPPFLEGALAMGERLDVLLVDRAPYAGLPTFKAMLRLCVATNNMKRGIALHKAMMQRDDLDLEHASDHFGLLIECCTGCGQLESALQVWRSMGSVGCAPNVGTYNSLIGGCCALGRFDRVDEILDGLPVQPPSPRSVRCLVLGSTLRLLVEHKQFRHALRVLDRMTAAGCEVTSFQSFASIVDFMIHAGDVGAAYRVFNLGCGVGWAPSSAQLKRMMWALLRAGRYNDVRAVLQVYDAAGFVRLNILHEALGAVGLGPTDEQGVGRGGARAGSGSRGAAAGDARQ